MRPQRGLPALFFVATLLAGCTHGGSHATAPSSASLPRVHLPRGEVHRIEADLQSGNGGRIRRAIEVPAGKRLDPQFLRSIHGLQITFQPSTAVAVGPRQVALDASVTSPDGSTSTWRVTLDQVRGRYVVADTRPVQP